MAKTKSKNKSKTKNKKSAFAKNYWDYIERTFEYSTKKYIKTAKDSPESNEYKNIMQKYITNFSNADQIYIGSSLLSLLEFAKNDPARYARERRQTLSDLYNYISTNKVWSEFWDTVKKIEKKVENGNNLKIVVTQLYAEISHLLATKLPINKMLLGLRSDGEPIIEQLPFPMTDDLISHRKNAVKGRKKNQLLAYLGYFNTDYKFYLTKAYGYYDQDSLDLLAMTSVPADPQHLDPIKFPRILENELDFEFINRHARYTLNPNGVVVECYNCGDVNRIYLNEKEVDGKRTVVWKIVFDTPAYKMVGENLEYSDEYNLEYSGVFAEDLHPKSIFSSHTSGLDFEFKVYDFVFECYADVVCGIDVMNKHFGSNTVNVGTTQVKEDEEFDQTNMDGIGLRFTPKKVYDKAHSSSSSKEELANNLEKYFVSGHLRKLPDGHSSSKEALTTAGEYGINVPDGYTFVRPYSSADEKVRTKYVKRL